MYEWMDVVADLEDTSYQCIAAMLNFGMTIHGTEDYDVTIKMWEKVRSVLMSISRDTDFELYAPIDCHCVGMLCQEYLLLGNKEKGLEYKELIKSWSRNFG